MESLESIPAKKEAGIKKKLLAGCLAVSSFFLMSGDVKLPDIVELNHTHASSDIEDTMTVMTANVHGWQTTNHQNNFKNFQETLETEKPDIACMQEVLADGPELQQLFDDGYNVLFATTIWYPTKGRFGNAVISKSPIDLKQVVSLPNPTTVTPRNAIVFEVKTSEGAIDMMNVHLSINSNESLQQLNNLSAEEGKHIQMACGDFNQQPKAVSAGPFGRMASPKILRVGLATFPASDPEREIDYVLPGCGVIDNNKTHTAFIGSDHLSRIEEIDITQCTKSSGTN